MARIAYVITDSGIGGSEAVLTNVLSRLDRSHHSVSGVVVLKTKRESAFLWEALGVPVVALNGGRGPSPSVALGLRRQLKAWAPDVVHAFLFQSVQLARFVKLSGVPFSLVSSPRVNYRFAPAWTRAVDTRLKFLDDAVLCESQSTADYLKSKLDYREDVLYVVRNGVDGKRFAFSEDARRRVRGEWGISEATVLIGGVGRLHAQKGFDVLLEALGQLKSIRVPHQLVLVGDGPEKDALASLAKSLGLPLVFAGVRADMDAVYSALDVYVQSSRYEGLSNSLLEALAAGRPCAATAVDGTLDVALDGTNMILIKPEDPISLSVGLGLLLEKPDLRAKLAQGALKTAAEFSLEKTVEGFDKVYRSALKIY